MANKVRSRCYPYLNYLISIWASKIMKFPKLPHEFHEVEAFVRLCLNPVVTKQVKVTRHVKVDHQNCLRIQIMLRNLSNQGICILFQQLHWQLILLH